MHRWAIIGFFVLWAVVFNCSGPGRETVLQSAPHSPTGQLVDESGQVSVYIYRNANFAGGGRIHLLQVDGRTLGPLTDSNYYHIYLWPGRYHINIHLPAEDFLGQSKPAINKSLRLMLPNRFAGNTFIYVYTDGERFRRLDGATADVGAITGERSLAKYLEAEQTAQVTDFLDTRYDGPSLLGKPHGRGTLTWDDGCRYEGVFDYGQLTPEGKFYFADGRIYMGQLHKSRPKGRGILLSPEGRVMYAGFFVDEAPHGRGIRRGPYGPEYCNYEHGTDITKSIRQLADEAVEAEEKALEALIEEQEAAETAGSPLALPDEALRPNAPPEASAEAPSDTPPDTPEGVAKHEPDALEPEESKDVPSDVQGETEIITPATQAPEAMAEQGGEAATSGTEAAPEGETLAGVEEKTTPDAPDEPDYRKQLEHMQLYRQWRIIVMRKAITAEHQADLDQEKAWCDDELADGRDWCICAPFDPDAGQWKSCMR
jgi:hypothetical protein